MRQELYSNIKYSNLGFCGSVVHEKTHGKFFLRVMRGSTNSSFHNTIRCINLELYASVVEQDGSFAILLYRVYEGSKQYKNICTLLRKDTNKLFAMARDMIDPISIVQIAYNAGFASGKKQIQFNIRTLLGM